MMKRIKKLLILIVIIGAGTMQANSQALVAKNFAWLLSTDDGLYPAVETMAVFTPSGNILHKQAFLIDLDDSLVPEKGVNKVAFTTWVNFNGVVWEMVNVQGKVFPDGMVEIVFHSNGSGTKTPNKKE